MAGFVTLRLATSGVSWRLFDLEAVCDRGEAPSVGVSLAGAGKEPESCLAIRCLVLSGSFLAQNSSIVSFKSLTPQYLYSPFSSFVYILMSSSVAPSSGPSTYLAHAANSSSSIRSAASWIAQASASAALIRAGDQPSRDEPVILRLSYLSAVELVSEIGGALGGGLSLSKGDISPGLNMP